MYIVALRVKAKSGSVGTNAYLHLHRDMPIPMRAPGKPDLDAVSNLEGGYLIAQSTEVTPGGNEVLAHLSVVAPDDADETVLEDLVGRARACIGTNSTPILVHEEGVVVGFGALIGFDSEHDELRAMFDSLWEASRSLLSQRGVQPPPVHGAYVVWAEPAADGLRLWLPPATLARLPRSVRRRARALVPPEAMAMGSVKDLLHEMALALLDIAGEQLEREGGIEVIEPRSGKVLATFPPPVSA